MTKMRSAWKRAGGGMDGVRARMHHAGDDGGERARGADRRVAARGDDGAGDGARPPLFAERGDDRRKVALGRRGHDLGRGRSSRPMRMSSGPS